MEQTTIILHVLMMSFANCNTHCPAADCRNEISTNHFPNPRVESGQCGRFCKDTWICDPCNILTNETADNIDSQLGLFIGHAAQCSSGNTYYIAVAIVPKIQYYTSTYHSNIKTFAKFLISYWNLETDSCGNGVSIVISRDDRQVYTWAGEAASKSLQPSCITDIYKDAKVYLTAGRYGAGLQIMITKYKDALDKGRCYNHDNARVYILAVILPVTMVTFIGIFFFSIFLC